MIRQKKPLHSAKLLRRLAPPANIFLREVLRRIAPEVCIALLQAFGADGRILSQLYNYAAKDLCRKSLDLSLCPPLDGNSVAQAIILLAENPGTLNVIRESGDVIVVRIILELLYRFGCVIHFRDISDCNTDVRRSACHLIDAILVTMSSPGLSHWHIYLFAQSIRAMLCFNKLPRGASIRMQQIEYFLNPLSRVCYYSSSHGLNYSSTGKLVGKEDKLERSSAFMKLLSAALERKYKELQRAPICLETEIKAKSRVFEIITRLTQRLFGASPCLFGSGASGLATAASDMDIVVLQSRKDMRRVARFAALWHTARQKDYCPFPAMSRVWVRDPAQSRDDNNGSKTESVTVPEESSVFRSQKKSVLLNRRPSTFSMARKAQLGRWKWLQRSTREVAAIWCGRMLAPRLARFGWSVECVESARVPILRVVAAVNSKGQPRPIPIGYKNLDGRYINDREGSSSMRNGAESGLKQSELFGSKTYLDPAICVGKQNNWDGDVADPFCPNVRKPFWELNGKERRQINKTLQYRIDQLIEKAIECPKNDWSPLNKSSVNGKTQEDEENDSDIICVCTDISFNHEVVVHNTRLMKSYAEIQPLLVVLGILIKHWAKQRGICDSYHGTLSGYQWMLIVIHYLQYYLVTSEKNPIPLLPNLQNPPPHIIVPKPQIADNRYNIFFYHPFRGPNKLLSPSLQSAPSVESSCIYSEGDSENQEILVNRGEHVSYKKKKSIVEHEFIDQEKRHFSQWPEDVFKDNPYDYAKHVLSPVSDNYIKQSFNHSNRSKLLEIYEMRQYSCPNISNYHSTAQAFETSTVLPVEEMNLNLNSLVTGGELSLGTLLQQFFDYFGFRFNCYTHVISIDRTPGFPQKKVNYFLLNSSSDPTNAVSHPHSSMSSSNFCVADTPIAQTDSVFACRSSQPIFLTHDTETPVVQQGFHATSSVVEDILDSTNTLLLQLSPESGTLLDADISDESSSSHAILSCCHKEDLPFQKINVSTPSLDSDINDTVIERHSLTQEIHNLSPILDDHHIDDVEDDDDNNSAIKHDLISPSFVTHPNLFIEHGIDCKEHLSENQANISTDAKLSSSDDDQTDPMVTDSENDAHLSLDSLYGSDTDSDTCLSDTAAERRQELRAYRRASLISARISASKTKKSFRQRPYLCILDPFERDRTIGPGRRDGFTQIVFELVRARSLLLEAECAYINRRPVDIDTLVSELFAETPKRPNRYSIHPDPRESPYQHLSMYNYTQYERLHSPGLKRMIDHISNSAKETIHSDVTTESRKDFPLPIISVHRKLHHPKKIIQSYSRNVLLHIKQKQSDLSYRGKKLNKNNHVRHQLQLGKQFHTTHKKFVALYEPNDKQLGIIPSTNQDKANDIAALSQQHPVIHHEIDHEIDHEIESNKNKSCMYQHDQRSMISMKSSVIKNKLLNRSMTATHHEQQQHCCQLTTIKKSNIDQTINIMNSSKPPSNINPFPSPTVTPLSQ